MKKDTKICITKAVISLMETKKMHEIRIREVTDIAKISRGTFYIHFDDIYQVIEELETQILSEVDAASSYFHNSVITKEFYFRPHPILVSCLSIIKGYGHEVCVLLGSNGDDLFRQKCKCMLEDHIVKKIIQDTNENCDKSYYILRAFLVTGWLGAIEEWLTHYPEKPVEDMAILLTQLGLSAFYPK